jgi:hypothetical protein
MERRERHRQAIRQLLSDRAALDYSYSNPEIETQLIFDAESDRYLLLDVGWDELKRVYHCFIHLDLKDGKIWIQRNMTETDLAKELVNMGVSPDDIVIGLHPPYKRPLTGYAVN